MNANDLAALLSGANVTINVHHGSGDIHSQSGHRITQNNAAPRSALPIYTCGMCGHTSANRRDFNMHFGGDMTCWKCMHAPDEKRRIERKRAQMDDWQRARAEAIDEPATPAQIAAPQEAPDYLNAILTPRHDLWRELEQNAARHAEEEYRRIKR